MNRTVYEWQENKQTNPVSIEETWASDNDLERCKEPNEQKLALELGSGWVEQI